MIERILITGSNGLLGQALIEKITNSKHLFLATSKGENRNSSVSKENYFELDITDDAAVKVVFEKFKPTVVIHTAAYTNVDACETDVVGAEKLNVFGTKFLLEAAKSTSAYFIFLSTDFIFDGDKGNYSEIDLPNPLSVYGKTKLQAEQVLMSSEYQNFSILRTSIIYGNGQDLSRGNIISWAKEQLLSGKEITMVNDQFRAPTFAPDLAQACMNALKVKIRGVFHIAGPEILAMSEIVKRVASFWNCNLSQIIEISSDTLNQKAIRPPKTGFDLRKSKKFLDYKPHSLEESFLKMS